MRKEVEDKIESDFGFIKIVGPLFLKFLMGNLLNSEMKSNLFDTFSVLIQLSMIVEINLYSYKYQKGVYKPFRADAFISIQYNFFLESFNSL